MAFLASGQSRLGLNVNASSNRTVNLSWPCMEQVLSAFAMDAHPDKRVTTEVVHPLASRIRGTPLKVAEPPLTITTEFHTDGRTVHFVVKLLLKVIADWMNAHPDSAVSRFMLKQRGPRTDIAGMNRLQRLSSALVFLLWGCLFFGLWLLATYLTFGLDFFSQDNPLVQVLIFGLALLSGCGVVGGLYLLLRVFV